MTIKLKYVGALAGLALAQGASAQQISKPFSAFVGNSTPGIILCRGGSAPIPMTADEEQSMPLHVVARLECGQQVSLLSASEGYTVNVRTADGKSGYVAWMNVAKGEAPAKPVQQEAVVHDGVASWTAGTAGSDRFFNDGVLVESLTVNGVTVQVSLQDTGWKFLANVAVANGSIESVKLTPAHISLADTQNVTRKALAYEDPKKLRGAVNHQILWSEANAAPSTSGYLVDSAYHVADNQPSTTQNYLAEHQATVALVTERKADFNPHSQMNTVALKDTELLPNQHVAGATWFQREGKREDMVLSVPVGNVVYQFPFAFSDEKK
jgi:hypothetical protein